MTDSILNSVKSLPVYDIFVIVFLLLSLVLGGKRGMAAQILSTLSWVAAWYLSSRYGYMLKPYIPFEGDMQEIIAAVASFIILLMALRLAGKILGAFFKGGSVFKEMNRQVGALLGLLKGMVICLIITFFAVIISPKTKDIVTGSQSGRAMVMLIFEIQKTLPDDKQHEQIRKAFEEFTKAAGGEEALSRASEEYKISAFKDDIAKSYEQLKVKGTALKETVDDYSQVVKTVNTLSEGQSVNSEGKNSLFDLFRKSSDTDSASSDTSLTSGAAAAQTLAASAAMPSAGSNSPQASSIPYASPVPEGAASNSQSSVMKETDSLFSNITFMSVAPYGENDAPPTLSNSASSSASGSGSSGGGETWMTGGSTYLGNSSVSYSPDSYYR